MDGVAHWHRCINSCLHWLIFLVIYHKKLLPYAAPLPQRGGHLLYQGHLRWHHHLLASVGTYMDTLRVEQLMYMYHLAQQQDEIIFKPAADSPTNQLPAALMVTNLENCHCKLSLKALVEEEIESSTSSLQPWSQKTVCFVFAAVLVQQIEFSQ